MQLLAAVGGSLTQAPTIGLILVEEVSKPFTLQFASVLPIAILLPLASTPVAPALVEIGSTEVEEAVTSLPPSIAPDSAIYSLLTKFRARLTTFSVLELSVVKD